MSVNTRMLPAMVLAGFAILGMMTFVPLPAAAISESDTISIPAGSFAAVDFSLGTSGSLTYSVSVSSGPYIDVLVMSRTEGSNYESGGYFQYYVECSSQYTKYVSSKTCYPPSGSSTLYFDNSNQGSAQPYDQAVTITYSVSTTGDSGTGGDVGDLAWFGVLCLIPLIIIIVIIVIIIIVVMKKKQQPAVQQPVYQQPMYQQPPPQYPPQNYGPAPPPQYGPPDQYGAPPPPPGYQSPGYQQPPPPGQYPPYH